MAQDNSQEAVAGKRKEFLSPNKRLQAEPMKRRKKGGFERRNEAEKLKTQQDTALRLCVLCRQQILRAYGNYPIHERTLDCSGCPACQLIMSAFPENKSPRTVPKFFGRNFRITFPSKGTDFYKYMEVFNGNDEVLGNMRIEHDVEARPGKILEILDFGMATAWLVHCQQQHREHCDTRELLPRHSTPLDVIFIDVIRDCLCYETTESRYFALSYVWGNAITSTTTTENLATLLQPGSLKSTFTLPKTISDALTLTKRMEVRFLWVDCLCIVQDSQKKHRDIKDMDIIFSQAELTIAALSGADADSGLSGVQEGTRRQRTLSTRTGRHSLSISFPGEKFDLARESTYMSRGWTFQELLFSRRILFITRDEALFHCNTSRRSESHPQEYLDDNQEFGAGVIDLWSQKRLPHDRNLILTSYAALISEYGKRRLTFEEDIENAFAGLASILEQWCEGDPVIHGVMSKFFAFSLCWSFGENQTLGYHYQSEIGTRRRGFPSWSWVGWKVTSTLIADNLSELLPLQSMVSNVEITSYTDISQSQCFQVLDRSAKENNASQAIRISLRSSEKGIPGKSKLPMYFCTLKFEGQRTDWINFETYRSFDPDPTFCFKRSDTESLCGLLSIVPGDEFNSEAARKKEQMKTGSCRDWSLVRMYQPKTTSLGLKFVDNFQRLFGDSDALADVQGAPNRIFQTQLEQSQLFHVLLVRRHGEYWERIGSGLMLASEWPSSTSKRAKYRAYNEKMILI